MRRKLLYILLSVLFSFSLFFSFVLAADLHFPDKVVDTAGLLTDAEEEALRNRIAEVIRRYECDIVILTVDSTDGASVRAFADDYFDYNGYGIGNDADGILLLISMEERDWYISTSGSAIRVLTDYGIAYIGEQITDGLGSGDYKGAFDQFVSLCDAFLKQADTGNPYDVGNAFKEPRTLSDYIFYLFISVAIGAVIAFIITSSMKRKLKTILPQHSAHAYIREDGVRLTNSKDLYLYRTVSRTAKPKNTNGGGRGGSSTHKSSSGRSHGGGGGKF